jgi:hypothetical protein
VNELKKIILVSGSEKKQDLYKEFCLENFNGRNCLVNPGVDGRITLTQIVTKQVMKIRNGLSWSAIGSNGRLLT